MLPSNDTENRSGESGEHQRTDEGSGHGAREGNVVVGLGGDEEAVGRDIVCCLEVE
jgi:hypothetical protein